MRRKPADVAYLTDLAYELVTDTKHRRFREASPAMTFSSRMPPGLSPVAGKNVAGNKIVAEFDGDPLLSDAGILVLREADQRLRVAERMAACIVDPRALDQITHARADIIFFRLIFFRLPMIAAGYEDGNDANSPRVDPIFKMPRDRAPSDRALC